MNPNLYDFPIDCATGSVEIFSTLSFGMREYTAGRRLFTIELSSHARLNWVDGARYHGLMDAGRYEGNSEWNYWWWLPRKQANCKAGTPVSLTAGEIIWSGVV